MKLYKHTGPGHYVGSYVLVFHDDDAGAQIMIRDILNKWGLKDEPLNIEVIEVPEHPMSVLEVSGEY